MALTGCQRFSEERRQAEVDKAMEDDSQERQARLKAEGKLNPEELKALAHKLGWAQSDARGLPPPPTTEELEKKVKAAEQKP
ncbi:MAG: hypothetical protein D4R66_05480 [Opitutales bacterium]|nr:MAG: hypothetical protein D4R66_05480 [Opitutales bacterium]